MLKQKSFLIFLFFIFLISSSLVSAHYWDFVTIGQGDNRWCKLFGACEIDSLIVNNLTIDNGSVTFINKTVININVTGEMIISGGITSDNITVDNIFALIDEINMRNNINLNKNNLNNVSNITIEENVFLSDSDHFLTQEYEPIDSIAGSAMFLVDTGDEDEGEIIFGIIHAPNNNITDLKIIQCNQVGRNNSFSCYGNSQGMIRNDICTANPRFNNGTHCNMTAITDYLIQCEVWNKSCEFFADTKGREGPLLWTQGDLEVWRKAKIMEEIK
ncbi:hypothetical protein LCGC14_1301870, partial [marine sediment metagenome]